MSVPHSAVAVCLHPWAVVLFFLLAYDGPMKFGMTMLALLLLVLPLGAAEPTANDVTVAVAAITDASISAVAAFLNTPSLVLPGIEMHQEIGQSLPYALSFTHSDIASYIPLFQQTQPAKRTFFSSLLSSARGPLNELALQFLTVHAWQPGHASLTGSASTAWGTGVTLTSLMTKAVSGSPLDPIVVKADVEVTGTRVSMPVHVRGTFVIESNRDGFVEIKALSMNINGDEVMTPKEE